MLLCMNGDACSSLLSFTGAVEPHLASANESVNDGYSLDARTSQQPRGSKVSKTGIFKPRGVLQSVLTSVSS